MAIFNKRLLVSIILDKKELEKGKEQTNVGTVQKAFGCLEENRKTALKDVIEKLIEEDGWALLARIATEMKNKYSDFVPKNYNCRSLKEMLQKVMPEIGNYEIGTATDGTTMFVIPSAKKAETAKKTAKTEEDKGKKIGGRKTPSKVVKPRLKLLSKGNRKTK